MSSAYLLELKKVRMMSSKQPVLSIVVFKGGLQVNPQLQTYMGFTVARSKLPQTLTGFCSDYLDFLVANYLKYTSKVERVNLFRFGVEHSLDTLGKFAFHKIFYNVSIKEDALLKSFNVKHDEVEKALGFAMGLLDEDELSPRTYKFKDFIIAEFLTARYIFRAMLRKCYDKHSKHLPFIAVNVLDRLPQTQDIWAMVFGLLAEDGTTSKMQCDLLQDMLHKLRNFKNIGKSDITSMCIQSLYESGNKGNLSDVLEHFTTNQTVRMADLETAPYKAPYMLCALGFLVRTAPNIYGLDVSSSGINHNSVSLLADPANYISDNNLHCLDIHDNPLSSLGMMKLRRFLVKASQMTVLDISKCDIGDEGVMILSDLLMCMALLRLDISENNMTDLSMPHLAKNFKCGNSLEILKADRNRLTDESVFIIAAYLDQLPNIAHITLSENNISQEAIQCLSIACENMEREVVLIADMNQPASPPPSADPSQVVIHLDEFEEFKYEEEMKAPANYAEYMMEPLKPAIPMHMKGDFEKKFSTKASEDRRRTMEGSRVMRMKQIERSLSRVEQARPRSNAADLLEVKRKSQNLRRRTIESLNESRSSFTSDTTLVLKEHDKSGVELY